MNARALLTRDLSPRLVPGAALSVSVALSLALVAFTPHWYRELRSGNSMDGLLLFPYLLLLGAGGVIPNALLLAKRASPLSRWGLFIAVGAAVLAGIELVISIVVPFC